MKNLRIYGKRNILYIFILYLFRIFPIKRKKIFVANFKGKGFADNPKYIIERLNELDDSYKIYWMVESYKIKIPDYIVPVKKNTIISLYHIATARIWIDDCRKDLYFRKRKGQFYIQTWHAGIGNKLGEAFAIDKLPAEYILAAKNDSKMADLFLSNSEWLSCSYRNSYWYKGSILKKGLPREDILFDDKLKFHKEICDFYEVENDTKFILYAPTFRNDGNIEVYNIDYKILLDSFNIRYKGCWKLIIRLHPNIQNLQDSIEYSSTILNGSKYEDINRLIMASDFVISDYSSCLFDALLANCNAFVYASDLAEYQEKERGFAFTWEEQPFLIAENNEQLSDIVMNFNDAIYKKKRKEFLNTCGFYEHGNASTEVAKYIINLTK